MINKNYICTELQRRTQRLRLEEFTLQESTLDSPLDEDSTTPADLTAATPTAGAAPLLVSINEQSECLIRPVPITSAEITCKCCLL